MGDLVLAGSTSGTVTISPPASAGTTTLTLPSTSGTVVTTNTLPAGSVLQVVHAQNSTRATGSTQTYIDAVSASITPTKSSSKILVIGHALVSEASTASNSVGARLYRNSTLIGSNSGTVDCHSGGWTANSWNVQTLGVHYLDSPATTSSITYYIKAAHWDIGVVVNGTGNNSGTFASGDTRGTSQIILMEIAA